MKTNTKISALILVISMMFASSTFAMKNNIDFEEEAYIDDIPFSTEWVVNELITVTVDFEDEAYVDDIPFNTAAIAANYNYEVSTALTYEMVEEEYVDDIPFSTEWIANEVLSEPVKFEEEAYVDDIPFNTEYIAVTALEYEMTEEAYVDDIPFDTYAVAMQSLTDSHFIVLKK